MTRKCEECPSLDLAALRRRGLLKPGAQGGRSWKRYGETFASVAIFNADDRLVLQYSREGSSAISIDLLPFEWTTTAFGGRRQWLSCPKCERRCRVVYGIPFRCRRCRGLRYSSQYETTSQRALGQADKICTRLGGAPGDDDLPDKPKGMHWRTYYRLEERYWTLQHRWTVTAMARFGIS